MTCRKDEIKQRLEPQRPHRVFQYLHGDGRIGVMLELEAQTDFALKTELLETFAHEVCLQICSMAPVQLNTNPIVGMMDPRAMMKTALMVDVDGKPEESREKIVAGKMAKWDKENVLMKMPWVKDNSVTIEEMCNRLSEELCEAVTVVRFARFGK